MTKLKSIFCFNKIYWLYAKLSAFMQRCHFSVIKRISVFFLQNQKILFFFLIVKKKNTEKKIIIFPLF